MFAISTNSIWAVLKMWFYKVPEFVGLQTWMILVPLSHKLWLRARLIFQSSNEVIYHKNICNLYLIPFANIALELWHHNISKVQQSLAEKSNNNLTFSCHYEWLKKISCGPKEISINKKLLRIVSKSFYTFKYLGNLSLGLINLFLMVGLPYERHNSVIML